MDYFEDLSSLVLAAEEFEPNQFDQSHRFSAFDDGIIRRLVAHGPVLLRGGRGAGKSALMIAAARRLHIENSDAPAIGIYLSLRYLPLLRSSGAEYESIFLSVLLDRIADQFPRFFYGNQSPSIQTAKSILNGISREYGRRIVLLFDDAAHIGREASLQEFFDLFRTLSSSYVSCKAAIYPGVTHFGTRFDIYNDATTIDLLRSESATDYDRQFEEIFNARFPALAENIRFSSSLGKTNAIGFLARSVLGNMRGFVFAANKLGESAQRGQVDLPALTEVLKNLAENYYWPLLEELRPKLGIYEPMLDPAQDVGERIFRDAAEAKSTPSVVLYKDIVGRLGKPLELLEYGGFIARREASKAMKSGGRGARYQLNLCNLLEKVKGSRLTQDLYQSWLNSGQSDPIEFHRGSELASIEAPAPKSEADLGILKMDIEKLRQSPAYPYGLSDQKVAVLREAGLHTIGELADATDDALLSVPSVGKVMLARIRNVVGQAIWM